MERSVVWWVVLLSRLHFVEIADCELLAGVAELVLDPA